MDKSRYIKALKQICNWSFATDGRKFKGDHKEVLKQVIKIAYDALTPTVGEKIEQNENKQKRKTNG